MATLPRNESRNRTNNNDNNNTDHQKRASTPPVPTAQWQRQPQDNEFTFWIDSPSLIRATISDSNFPNLSVEDRAILVIGFQFTNEVQVYHFIQRAIRQKMIWEPACEIYDVEGLFDGEFITFCRNWLQVMYSCIRTAKKSMLTTSLLENMEIIALQKLNELHAGIEQKKQNVINFSDGFLTPLKFKKRYVGIW